MEETTYIKPEWHILKLSKYRLSKTRSKKSKKRCKVYSKGLRCYGAFDSVTQAYIYIIENFPTKRGKIVVQNSNGSIAEVLRYPLKVIKRS